MLPGALLPDPTRGRGFAWSEFPGLSKQTPTTSFSATSKLPPTTMVEQFDPNIWLNSTSISTVLPGTRVYCVALEAFLRKAMSLALYIKEDWSLSRLLLLLPLLLLLLSSLSSSLSLLLVVVIVVVVIVVVVIVVVVAAVVAAAVVVVVVVWMG